jgi:hypothetical protein
VSSAWTSTKALSVYNVLLKANLPLSLDEVCALLQKNWRADIDDEYVAMGAGYLMAQRLRERSERPNRDDATG